MILYSSKNRSISGHWCVHHDHEEAEEMYGPTFNVGDEIVWEGSPAPGHREKSGPFRVATVENNDDSDACMCGASLDNDYFHDYLEEMCDEVPSQLVTVSHNGKVIKNADGSDAVFYSDWFRKV